LDIFLCQVSTISHNKYFKCCIALLFLCSIIGGKMLFWYQVLLGFSTMYYYYPLLIFFFFFLVRKRKKLRMIVFRLWKNLTWKSSISRVLILGQNVCAWLWAWCLGLVIGLRDFFMLKLVYVNVPKNWEKMCWVWENMTYKNMFYLTYNPKYL